MRTAVLIPCYNESATIGKVVADFRALDPSVEVFVYDNNSTDDTARIAREAGATVRSETRQGKGAVIRRMFREIDADVYVMVDGDDTYDAADALGLRELVTDEGADMVIGDRLSSSYFEQNTRPLHGFGNRLVLGLVNGMFDTRVHDIMTGCRCMSRMFVKNAPVLSSGFEVETELTIHALDRGFVVMERAIGYRDRGDGSHSKLHTYRDGMRILSMLFRLFRDFRPMRFFGVLALVLAAASLIAFWVPLSEYLRTGLVRRFPTLIESVAFGLASMLAFTSGVLLDSMRTQARQAFEHQLVEYYERQRQDV